MKVRILGMALILAATVQAQVNLPSVQVPQLPASALPTQVQRTVSSVTGTVESVAEVADPRRLSVLRGLRIRTLLRDHAALIERDPRGAPIVRHEVVAFSPSEEALQRLLAGGFEIARERKLAGFDATLIVLRAPAGLSTQRALQRVRKLDPQGSYDFNHIYTESGAATSLARTAPQPLAQSTRVDPVSVKVGLIDGGVDITHPVFQGAKIHQHGCAGKPVASPHGTAVASLLTGRDSVFHGAAPGAQLFAADVYCGEPTGGAVDAVAEAFAWMSRERVAVINVSLVGPANIMLEQVVRAVIARGHIVIAAVGNDGPAAPPLYPAAYSQVVGVTGVDAQERVLWEAGRGKQVDFAAPGADMVAAGVARAYAAVRGTSFASPLVAGLLASQMREPDKALASEVITQLANRATDLGARGVDSIYGRGLVASTLRTAPSKAQFAQH